MKNNLAKRYIFRVSRRMPVGGKQKREFLAALQEDVEQYILENPSATRAQLEAQFGSPDDIAADFIAQMPYREINDKFRARNRIVAVAVAVALVIAMIWAAAVFCALHDIWGDGAGFGAITVITNGITEVGK